MATRRRRLDAAVVLLCLVAMGAGRACAEGGEEPSAAAVEAPATPPPYRLPVGERLGFHGRWFGIPVGHGWIEVKEIVELEGRQAYVIELQGHTNHVLSKLYPIHDVLRSYVDVETLRPLRFEKDQREGHYRAQEVVTFDHARRVATYRSLLNQSVKDIPLPEDFQDLLSALYWFRAQPVPPAGGTLALQLYTDEKIYDLRVALRPAEPLELLRRGTFQCTEVEPLAEFKGVLVKRGRLWAYVTADPSRLPLLVKALTPWGAMSAVIDEASIPPGLQLAPVDADRGPTGP